MTRPYAVVLNPRAGGGSARRAWPDVQRELERRGLTYTLIEEASGDAALARVAALPIDVAVLAVGGDGTVGALLPAVVGTGRPLGIVPLGTGNDFAGLLGLRPGDLGAALDRLAFQPRRVDALEVEIGAGDHAGRRTVLLNGLGMGFDAQVAANMARAPAALRGFARYAWSAVLTVKELALTPVTVTVDGAVQYAGPSALVAVMNGTRYGGGFQISPQSDVRDGCLDVLASREVTRASLLGLMIRVLRGRHLEHARVSAGQGSAVTVEWARPVALHLDGDLAGMVTRLHARVLPGAVALLNA
ncbi:YegS/Rv2252/BmrU family lipid kinase [Deinococcus metalli]|uniref:Diacylglycerol kinase n=1 Tax=Deinococcus metalli TaxID=1141878 RepID=A0A7W8NQP6_9DEIO|nr:diacylglycerol kinase family protein [Deinococcus metalli]MBB5375307.1 YegS/Rv2252/BmrU family lipid kinase [Deinococcus metalli]GHF30209.1 diacylglycerol kinase [Deinococcus metalli]